MCWVHVCSLSVCVSCCWMRIDSFDNNFLSSRFPTCWPVGRNTYTRIASGAKSRTKRGEYQEPERRGKSREREGRENATHVYIWFEFHNRESEGLLSFNFCQLIHSILRFITCWLPSPPFFWSVPTCVWLSVVSHPLLLLLSSPSLLLLFLLNPNVVTDQERRLLFNQSITRHQLNSLLWNHLLSTRHWTRCCCCQHVLNVI